MSSRQEELEIKISENIKKILSPPPSIDIKMDIYLYTYPYLIDHFKDVQNWKEKDLALGVLLVYGWMPTIPKNINKLKQRTQHNEQINSELAKSVLENIEKLKNIKKIEDLNKNEEILKKIQEYVNGSLIGASKLLHFINPDFFPIWDSKIYKNVTGQSGISSIKNIRYYCNYIKGLNKNIEEKQVEVMKINMMRFYKKNLDKTIKITSIRAAEFLIFKHN